VSAEKLAPDSNKRRTVRALLIDDNVLRQSQQGGLSVENGHTIDASH
jgi:hypothetical protein